MSEPGLPDGDIPISGSVDESLIDVMLALSPEERLRENDRMVRTILLLQQSVAAPDSCPDDRAP
jgi:hypothetical protein